jgi:hypothetical protein
MVRGFSTYPRLCLFKLSSELEQKSVFAKGRTEHYANGQTVIAPCQW